MIRHQANQSIGAQMISSATGAAFTGAVTVYLTLDAATQAIGTVGAGLCTHEGNGYHTYRPSQDETDGELIAFTFVGSGAIPVTIQVATLTAAQESSVSSATGSLSITVRQLVTDALVEIGVLNAVDPASGEDATLGVRKLNRLLDNWNAEQLAVYASVFEEFTTVDSQAVHTIGPSSADFLAVQRPQTIEGAALLISGQRYRLRIRDGAWWASVSSPDLTGQPTDLYYEPAWPNGEITLWPIGSAYTLELQRRVVLGQVALSDTFWLPPGYQDAITLTLAESLVAAFRVAMPPSLRGEAQEARARVFGANVTSVRICTTQAGMPTGRRGGFDFQSGQVI